MANLFKIAGNFMIMSAVETMGEAFALLRKGGVDAGLFLDTMTEGLFAGAGLQELRQADSRPKHTSRRASTSELGLKDANLVRDASERTGRADATAGSGARPL